MRVEGCFRVTLVVILCTVGASLHAADVPTIEPQASAAVERMAAIYNTAHSYSDVTTLSANGNILAPDNGLQFRARVVWEKPNKARIENYGAKGVALGVSDGKTLWVVTPRHKGYYSKRPANFNSINDAMNDIGVGGPGLVHVVEGKGVAEMVEEGLVSLKMGADDMIGGVQVSLVIARFDFPSGGSALETLSISPGDGLLRQVTQEYASNKGHLTIVETHTNIRLNPVLPKSTFAFAPPPHARPVDYFSEPDGDRFKPAVKVGEALPPFRAMDLDGKSVSLRDYRGKVVVVHFFATWEATSADVPEMVSLYDHYKGQGLAVVGVAMDARRERVTQLVAKDGVSYPVVFDGKVWDNAVTKLYGVRSLPTTLLGGRDGTLLMVAGRPNETGFEGAIKAALVKPK